MATSFYQQLYAKGTVSTVTEETWSFPKLNRNSLWWLNRKVTDQEIKTALFQINPSKAPVPDGIPASLFQRFWPLVGGEITAFVHGVFETGHIPEHLNHSLICLIPKIQHPETISQFRPICLSNVIIKVVSKIIANRLKPLMNELVGDSQASFVPGRQSSDNIVIARELLHSLRSKTGSKGAMIAKIDLEKAYDHVD